MGVRAAAGGKQRPACKYKRDGRETTVNDGRVYGSEPEEVEHSRPKRSGEKRSGFVSAAALETSCTVPTLERAEAGKVSESTVAGRSDVEGEKPRDGEGRRSAEGARNGSAFVSTSTQHPSVLTELGDTRQPATLLDMGFQRAYRGGRELKADVRRAGITSRLQRGHR